MTSEVHREETSRQAITRAESAQRRERWTEALSACRTAIEIAGEGEETRAVRADVLRGSAIVRVRLDEWQEAVRDVAESRLLAKRARDPLRIAMAENVRGAIEFERGNWREAERRYRLARRNACEAEDVSLLMEIENNEGALWAAQGDSRRAEEHFQRALEFFEEESRDPCGARVLTNLGMIYAGDGRHEAAEAAYEQALDECKRLGDVHQAATVMIKFGKLALSMDEPLRAHTFASTAETFAQRLDHGPMRADALLLMGSIARSARRWREAKRHLDRTLEMSRDGKVPLAEVEAWREIGEMRAERDRDREAIEAFRQARRSCLAVEAEGEAGRLEDRIRELRTRSRETESVVTGAGETR